MDRAEGAAAVSRAPDLTKPALFLLTGGWMPKSVVHEEVG